MTAAAALALLAAFLLAPGAAWGQNECSGGVPPNGFTQSCAD